MHQINKIIGIIAYEIQLNLNFYSKYLQNIKKLKQDHKNWNINSTKFYCTKRIISISCYVFYTDIKNKLIGFAFIFQI